MPAIPCASQTLLPQLKQLLPSVDASSATRLRVVKKIEIADGIVTLTLADPSSRRLPSWTPGAHVDLVLPNGKTRQYSLCGDRFNPLEYRVAVLRERPGRGGSAWIHDNLQVGDDVGLGGPRNNFPMVPSPRYLFIAGGIGITPLLPMIAQAESLGADWSLLYGGRTQASMGFLAELSGYGDRVRVCPEDECGLLDLAGALEEASAEDTKVYACGPTPLLSALEQRCADRPEGFLRTERFVSTGDRNAHNEAFSIDLARSGRRITVAPQDSVLDVLARNGVNVVSSCQQGTCGTCEVPVLAGEVDHRDALLDDDERTAHDCMFVCVSRALNSHLVLDL